MGMPYEPSEAEHAKLMANIEQGEDAADRFAEADKRSKFEAKRDLYIHVGFAPGDYWSNCRHCTENFDGADKHATCCFDCATALINHLYPERATELCQHGYCVLNGPDVEGGDCVCDGKPHSNRI